MNTFYKKAAYEAPILDVEEFRIEEGFALSSGDPEDWKDSGNNWEQD